MADKVEFPPSVEEWAGKPRSSRECFEMIRVANHCLPDRDPHKLRRPDAERLHAIADAIKPEHENWDAKDFLHDMAGKIEAILAR